MWLDFESVVRLTEVPKQISLQESFLLLLWNYTGLETVSPIVFSLCGGYLAFNFLQNLLNYFIVVSFSYAYFFFNLRNESDRDFLTLVIKI